MKFRTMTGLATIAAMAMFAGCASSNNDAEMGVMGDDECCGSGGCSESCTDAQKKDGNMGVMGAEKSECTEKKSDCSTAGQCPFSGKQN